jgi:hypothetical protein
MKPDAPNPSQRETPTRPMRALASVARPAGPRTNSAAKTPASVHRGGAWLWALAVVGFTLALVSLILNAVLFLRLHHAGEVTGGVLDEVIAALDEVPGQAIDIVVPISQTIQFSTTVPFARDFDIPFQHTVTINRTVRVWVDAGLLGRIPIDIPIYATIPIEMNVPVHIDQRFPVQAEIPLEMVVPFHLEPEQLAVDAVIGTFRRWLTTIRELM